MLDGKETDLAFKVPQDKHVVGQANGVEFSISPSRHEGSGSHGANHYLRGTVNSAITPIVTHLADENNQGPDDCPSHAININEEPPLVVRGTINSSDQDIDLESGERTPLVSPSKPPFSWKRFGSTVLHTIYDTAKSMLIRVREKPIPTILGLVTSGQPAINAVVNPSNASPSAIGPAWWASMPDKMKAESVVNGIFSLWVNYPAARKWIEDAWTKLITKSTLFKSPRDFLDNVVSIYFALCSGLAASALTLSAFSFITFGGLAIPGTLAALSFLIISTSRYNGLKLAIRAIENIFKT